jgi:hypothetical protein
MNHKVHAKRGHLRIPKPLVRALPAYFLKS